MATCELTFRDDNDELVVITAKVMSQLLSFRQLSPESHEAAGVLIGERRGIHLVIHDLSVPGKGDKRTRFSVDRCGPHHQEAVDAAFYRSEGTLQYLGEWHTHPEDFPHPSFRDKRSWQSNLTVPAPVVLIIVGKKSLWAAKKTENSMLLLTEA
ncbi:peptidase [Enterobacter cloacae subsp. cloacae]|uniref:CBASS system CD-NTase/cGAS isopeptidase Cap3 n=1 Tax=Enterobacter cloacae TaxID=550 RepID=UPI00063AD323|nr:Mov34/MPN/PAD-1 family protein [Enterobacter cloacae]KLG06223.1 peptidase [Enterobacter cloacae subsp. cloacae]HEM8024294.1 Mov34/MPN/PAD-1 family protein [Enterobacter ludwigii]